ncbi:MAG: TM0106 family RecB-like putative nuclease [Candidatus Heimdallarchaeaceae archaeon]
MLISNYDIRLFYKCPMLLQLNKFGPEHERDFHPILGKYKHKTTRKPPSKDEIIANTAKTIRKMETGLLSINQGWLNTEKYTTKIDRLVKIESSSAFGEYSYIPVFLRNVKHIRKPLIMEGVLNSFILSTIQKNQVEHFKIQRKDDTLTIDVLGNLDELLSDLEKIEQILKNEITLSPNYTRNCRVCEWRKHCKKLAEEQLDLTLISGIGKRIKKQLEEQNISDVPSLAQATEDSISLENITPSEKEYLLLQAKTLMDKQERIRGKVNLPKKRFELFVDVEGSSHHNFVWIIGCLVREGNEHYYKHFLAESPRKEKEMFVAFMNYIESLNGDFTLYHWSLAEPQYFKNLANKFYTSKADVAKLAENSFDLFPIFKEKIIIPVYTYTLKEVANWLGFEWFDPLVDGATSIILFDNWFMRNDRKSLEKAISYNSDDCKALLVIKDYVAKRLS